MYDQGGHEEDTYGDEAVGVDEDDGNGEPSEEYRDGGYHPVSIGEIFNNRFKVESFCRRLPFRPA